MRCSPCRASLPSPRLLMVDAGICAASPLGGLLYGLQCKGFNCLFIFPPCYVALCASKARHRFSSEEVSWCLETSLFLRLPSRTELRPSLFCLFFCLLYFFLPPLEELGCFSGCLMSSAGIQKLFCGIYSAFKCSFDAFVGEKVFSPSYSSAILAPPPGIIF